MKRIISVLLLSILVFMSCETSEGLKYGTLQKVSHKKFPCDYYAAEFAFDGGRQVSNGKSSSYENVQSVEIDKKAFDTLQTYVGDKVVFDYKDRGIVICGESKQLTTLRIKKSTE